MTWGGRAVPTFFSSSLPCPHRWPLRAFARWCTHITPTALSRPPPHSPSAFTQPSPPALLLFICPPPLHLPAFLLSPSTSPPSSTSPHPPPPAASPPSASPPRLRSLRLLERARPGVPPCPGQRQTRSACTKLPKPMETLVEIIARKRDGGALTEPQIARLIRAYT